jgi:UDP-N-acetyl-D-glucosamine dehydrogenase
MLIAEQSRASTLFSRLETRTATIGIVGMGYVGLPLASTAARAGFTVIGFDVDKTKVEKLNAGRSYIDAVRDDALQSHIDGDRFQATCDFALFEECDVIAICVPTPLTKQREPDLSFVENTTRAIAKHLRKNQLVVLESTTYPGTTDEIMRPILEATGLRSGRDSSSDIRRNERIREVPDSRRRPFPRSLPGTGLSQPSLSLNSMGRSSRPSSRCRASRSPRW